MTVKIKIYTGVIKYEYELQMKELEKRILNEEDVSEYEMNEYNEYLKQTGLKLE